MAAVETLRINATESLTIGDNGEGWQVVTLVNGAAEYLVGLGRSRGAAIESAQANLQQVLNIVDVAIVQGSAHKNGRVNG